ncbi:MAG: S9 family peptidase [Pyrinomonadaceae bacterium]
MKKVCLRLFVVLCLFASIAPAQKRAITEADLFDLVWIGDPQISPDGTQAAFVRVSVNPAKTNYDTSIWTVRVDGSGEPSRITGGNRDTTPRWSPDGRFLAFVRSGEAPGPASAPQIYLLPTSGGEAFQLTNVPRGAGGAVWSPDGKSLAFGSSANPDDIAKQGKPATPADRESDVRVITRAVYRSDGAGYLDPTRPNHLWTVPTPSNPSEKVTSRQLTSGQFSEANFTWSNDGSKIFFTTNRDLEPYYDTPKTQVYSVAINGGEPALLTRLTIGVGAVSLSPDGKRIAFVASADAKPVQSYTQPDLWTLELESNAQPKNLTPKFDFDIGGALTGDQAAPRAGGGNPPIWSSDGSIVVGFTKEGRQNLATVDATGNISELTKGDHAVLSYRITNDRSRLVYLLSTPTRVGDLFASDASGSNAKQLTRFNDGISAKVNLTEPDEIWYTSFDGKRVQTWVQKPADFDPKKKYPLILNIHGGPHAAYGYVFDHEFQWMAAKGYIVVYPNPRGSTSYGQDFGNVIQYAYPGDDHKDLMLAVDEVIKRGYVDETKLGITGGSGGGVLTNYAVTQTDRFKAAVSQRDISNWASWWYTADFAQFQPSWFKGAPFEDVEGFRDRSAITHVAKIKTPMMFILGEADNRTPAYAGGEELFRALKYRKIPTVMVRFPNESHELSRSGQPWHRVERLQHIVAWFDKWLMGATKPEYEISSAP